jgi:hypothetical protein
MMSRCQSVNESSLSANRLIFEIKIFEIKRGSRNPIF